MKKSDLKTGMVVQMRNGKHFRVFLNTNDGDFISGSNEWNPLGAYREDFTSTSSFNSLDIVKVYDTGAYELAQDPLDLDRADVIWVESEPEETRKMTLEEIEEVLGYKVEIYTGVVSELTVPEPFPSWRFKSTAF